MKALENSSPDKAAALDAALRSETFSKSEQLRQFLRYICEREMAGEGDRLSEYVIGVEVFGRPEGYSLVENSSVRKRAYELRQKLERLYERELIDAEVRIEIPKGSYVPRFVGHYSRVDAVDERDTGRRSSGGRLWVAGLVVAAAAATGWWALASRGDVLTAFWAPALEHPSEVRICAGQSVLYRFTTKFQQQAGTRGFLQVLTEPLKIDPEQTIRGKDLVPVPNQYVGLGSAEAVATVHGWFSGQGKASTIFFGGTLSFVELRKGPAVIIGAFNNKWMMDLTKDLRYFFDTTEMAPVLRDRQSGRVWRLEKLAENGETNEDYVLVSRLVRSPSGQFVVAAAGLTQYGTRTVGEVLTERAALEKAMQKVGPGWEKQNLQMLLHVQVIRGIAGPPDVVAVHQW